jgi:cold shock CspA family protein
MASGKVLWFNPVMGHGYIQPSDGRTDVPVDRLAVELAGHKTLNAGQQVRYEVVRGLDGRPRAAKLRLIPLT